MRSPGFNDTSKSDTEILQDISQWLRETYEEDNKLSGIVYLHRERGAGQAREEGSSRETEHAEEHGRGSTEARYRNAGDTRRSEQAA